MSGHYTDGRRWSYISKAWIFVDSWNDREEIARLEATLRQVEEERDRARKGNDVLRDEMLRLAAKWETRLKQYEILAQERDQLRARAGELEEALQASRIGLDDWLNQYASELCDEERVKEARERIADNGGTLAYIAQLQDQNRRALKGKEEHGTKSND